MQQFITHDPVLKMKLLTIYIVDSWEAVLLYVLTRSHLTAHFPTIRALLWINKAASVMPYVFLVFWVWPDQCSAMSKAVVLHAPVFTGRLTLIMNLAMPGWAVTIFRLLTCKHCNNSRGWQSAEECVRACVCVLIQECWPKPVLFPRDHDPPPTSASWVCRVRQCGGHLLLVMHGVPVRWAARRPIWWSPASASVWPTPTSLLMVKVNCDQHVANCGADASVSSSQDLQLSLYIWDYTERPAVIDKSSCLSDYKL